MFISQRTAVARAAVALMALAPMWASAQCQPGQPGCTVPEPGTWALVGMALVVAVVVARKGRK